MELDVPRRDLCYVRTARTRRRRPRCKEETDPGWEERKAKWEERKAVKRSRIEAGLPVHPDSDDTDDTE